MLLVAVVSLLRAAPVPAYVGAASCEKCHTKQYQVWEGARHSKMVQPAVTQAVKGDFTRGAVTLRGQPFAVRQRGANSTLRNRTSWASPWSTAWTIRWGTGASNTT